MGKIRVLHLVQNLPLGGMERVVARLVAGLDRSRFERELWCLSGGGIIADDLSAQGIPVRVFDCRRYLFPGNIASLAVRIGKGGFHIVHTHTYAPGTIGRIAARLAGVPVIVHHQHTVISSQMTGRLKTTERCITSLTTDRIIACSDTSRQFLMREKFGSDATITVIFNGVPESFAALSGLRETVAERPGLKGKKIVLTVASLAPHKGHRYLIEAFGRIREQVSDAVLVFVGEGVERVPLETQARELGITDRVIFAGIQEDVRPFLETADLLAAPSLWENMSVSIIESMAKRLPVVASGVGGIPEVVEHGKTGILVPPKDPGALSQAILELLKDTERRRMMGENGFAAFNAKFTLARMLTAVQELYEELLKQKGIAV